MALSSYSHSERRRRPAALHKTQAFSAWRADGLDRHELILAPFDPDLNNIKGLYVHIPFCDGKCFYCAFYSLPYENELSRRYLRALEIELKEYPRLSVETVYFGGGTPSLLSLPELGFLCDLIKENISIDRLKEWTVECNPRSLTPEKLSLLAKAGVNRISLGAQSFDDSALKWLGRRHNVADIYEAARMIKSAGFENFGLDLIACIPGMNSDIWRNTLGSAVALKPKHISVYALTKEEGSRLALVADDGLIKPLSEQHLTSNLHFALQCHSRENGNPDFSLENSGFPLKAGMTFNDNQCNTETPTHRVKLLSEDDEIEALDLAEKILIGAGYRHYEISNFARPGFECLHNLSCWRGEEYIGLGAAAASHTGLKRWTNLPDLGKYLKALARGKMPPHTVDILNEKLKKVEMIVFGLRMAEGIAQATGKICEKTLCNLSEQGLVLNADGRWRLTERGFYLADYVGAEILAADC